MKDTFDRNYIKKLEKFIQHELYNSIYYENMANIAPTNVSRKILLDMSQDEKAHAELFNELYKDINGERFFPGEVKEVEIEDYKQALFNKLEEAAKDYQKYGKEYLIAPNCYIKDLFFSVKTTQAQHAMRLPTLLLEVC